MCCLEKTKSLPPCKYIHYHLNPNLTTTLTHDYLPLTYRPTKTYSPTTLILFPNSTYHCNELLLLLNDLKTLTLF